ncbi:hypothetical protein [Cryptobacterium curtum]|uniref:hypothetical protein n=1 Tax=Cryptobacterium curtum TaxID=84163 RepID=UPI0028D0BC1A|nr:hypothetical protein [Cryptobacterium curtum]
MEGRLHGREGEGTEERALIELFSDLIYVYAISRVTLLIEEPTGGIVSPTSFGRYIVLTLVVLQA